MWLSCSSRRRSRHSRPNAALISSRENEKLKLVRKLHDRRWRDKLGLFVAEGEDLVEAAREGGHEVVELLLAGENVEPALLAEVSTLGHPPRVIGIFRKRDWVNLTLPTALMLWRVADPGNVGTLLRSADAFGARGVVITGHATAMLPRINSRRFTR